MQISRLRARNVQRYVGARFIASGGREHGQVKIIQTGGAEVFQPCVVKIFVHQIQLLQNAVTQNRFGIAAKARTRCAAIGAIAKLNDSMTAVVGGLGVHAIAFHEGQAREIVGREPMLLGQLNNLVHHGLLVLRGNKALINGAIQGLFQHGIRAPIRAGEQLHLRRRSQTRGLALQPRCACRVG